MPIISVIVPVYKVEEYLCRCVDSIINQSFTSFDLILIDDGSPDKCGNICDLYAEKDHRIVVIHQNNQGLSQARNAGIEWAIANSDSKWIAFIDSDDWVHTDYLRLLYEAVIDNNLELSMCNCLKTSSFSVEMFTPKETKKLYTPEDFWCYRQYGSACAKLYKKDLFKNIRFPKGLLYEDIFVTYKILFTQKKLIYLEEPLYFCFSREDSITHSKWNPKVMSQIIGRKQQADYFWENKYFRAFEVTIINLIKEVKGQLEGAKLVKKQYYMEYLRLVFWYKYYLIKYHGYIPMNKYTNLYRSGLPFVTYCYKKYTFFTENKRKKSIDK